MSAPGTTGWRNADLRREADRLAAEGCTLDIALDLLGIKREGLRAAYKRHGLKIPEPWIQRPSGTNWADLREDADWLARTGCTIDRATERLGVNRDSLIAAYRRHNEPLPLPWRGDR